MLFCFSMCCNTKQNNQNSVIEPNNTVEGEVLNKQIQDGLMLFIDDMEDMKDMKEVNDTSVFDRVYTVEFFNKDFRHPFTQKDTVVVISTLNCDIECFGYKGIIFFKEFTVAIFDEANVGSNFYDNLCLEIIPLNTLECMNVYLRYTNTFRIKDGILKEWRPPLREKRVRNL